MRCAPASAASLATNSIPGVSTTGSSSFGTALVVGRNLVPRPAAGTMAVRNVVSFVAPVMAAKRSEEHTSELQSREKLVCRLLLEKKNFTEGGEDRSRDRVDRINIE